MQYKYLLIIFNKIYQFFFHSFISYTLKSNHLTFSILTDIDFIDLEHFSSCYFDTDHINKIIGSLCLHFEIMMIFIWFYITIFFFQIT